MPFAGPTVVSTSAAASDRRTFGDLKNQLALPFNPNDETTLAIAGNAVNNAIRKYNRKLWPWEILIADLTFGADDNIEPLPQPFKKPLAAHVIISTRQDRKLAYIPYESFVEYYSLRSVGQPTVYTLRNTFETGEMTVHPTPLSETDIRVNYYRRTPILRADTDPVEGPQEYEQGIIDEAWYEMVRMRPGMSGQILVDARNAAAVAEVQLIQLVTSRGDNVGIP